MNSLIIIILRFNWEQVFFNKKLELNFLKQSLDLIDIIIISEAEHIG
jgi:hypothetical protein